MNMKKYVFKPYSQIFPDLFQKEKERISLNLKELLAIEHVGSTAVPGLGGKGIIDIAIAVAKVNLDSTSQQLQNLGYEYRPAFSTPDRFYFIIYLPDPEEEMRRYHIHLTYPENSEWKDLIGFRDYLRRHPNELQAYAELKKQAAFEANHDGERYRKIKEPMFDKIRSLINHSKSEEKKMKLTIRKAEVKDARCIVEAEREIAQEPGLFCSQSSELDEKSVLQTIDSPAVIYLVAEHEGLIVGHGFLEPHTLQSLRHIADLNIAVHLAWQKKGIGKQLLEQLIERAKNSSAIEKIQLNVRASNASAISLYKKMGFQEEGRLKNRVKIEGRYIDDLIMGLDLKKNTARPPYHLQHYDAIPKEYEAVLYHGISEEAFKAKGFSPIHPFSIFIKDQKESVVGGVSGALFYGSLYIDSLWVDAALRHQGWGTKLLIEAEKIGRMHGATFVTLNTMDWEALPFYQRLGYSIEFTREGYEKGSKMFMLRKNCEISR